MQPSSEFVDESEIIQEARRLQAAESIRLMGVIARSVSASIARCVGRDRTLDAGFALRSHTDRQRTPT